MLGCLQECDPHPLLQVCCEQAVLSGAASAVQFLNRLPGKGTTGAPYSLGPMTTWLHDLWTVGNSWNSFPAANQRLRNLVDSSKLCFSDVDIIRTR